MLLERLDQLREVVRGEIDVLLHAARPLEIGERLLEAVAVDAVDDLAVHLDEPPVRVAREARRCPSSCASPSTASSFRPRLRIVSIIPGIETAAPERTETSSGSSVSPKRLPAFASSCAMCSRHLVLEAVRAGRPRACTRGRRRS